MQFLIVTKKCIFTRIIRKNNKIILPIHSSNLNVHVEDMGFTGLYFQSLSTISTGKRRGDTNWKKLIKDFEQVDLRPDWATINWYQCFVSSQSPRLKQGTAIDSHENRRRV